MATIKNSFLNILITTKKYNYDLLKAIHMSVQCISSSVSVSCVMYVLAQLWSLCDSDKIINPTTCTSNFDFIAL